jgi:hypothetical protein
MRDEARYRRVLSALRAVFHIVEYGSRLKVLA